MRQPSYLKDHVWRILTGSCAPGLTPLIHIHTSWEGSMLVSVITICPARTHTHIGQEVEANHRVLLHHGYVFPSLIPDNGNHPHGLLRAAAGEASTCPSWGHEEHTHTLSGNKPHNWASWADDRSPCLSCFSLKGMGDSLSLRYFRALFRLSQSCDSLPQWIWHFENLQHAWDICSGLLSERTSMLPNDACPTDRCDHKHHLRLWIGDGVFCHAPDPLCGLLGMTIWMAPPCLSSHCSFCLEILTAWQALSGIARASGWLGDVVGARYLFPWRLARKLSGRVETTVCSQQGPRIDISRLRSHKQSTKKTRWRYHISWFPLTT